MPRLPDGDPAPQSGELPPEALATLPGARFGVYVHVPFCAVRCGYCDFNTYTLTELGPGASTATFVDSALAELDLAVGVLGGAARPVDTVFVGGGTPTLLPAADLVRCVDGIRQRFGLAAGAEVTTEANPDSVTAADLDELAAGGFTRVSVGMQSVVPHVLATLERTHDPSRVEPRSREPGRPVSRRASTSSTAPRARPSRTGGRASTRRSRSGRTTSRPTPWSSRRAPASPRRCGAGRWPCPRGTTRPTSTSSRTRCSGRRLRLVRGEQLVP